MKMLFIAVPATLFMMATGVITVAAAAQKNNSYSQVIITSPPPSAPVNVEAPSTPSPRRVIGSSPVGTAGSSAPAADLSSVDGDMNFTPVVTLDESDMKQYSKRSGHYEISAIDGFLDVYKAGEQIIFYVSGRSDNMTVEPANGFNVVATIFELSTNAVNRAKITYDTDKSAWKVNFYVPLNSSNEYKILLNLFCEKTSSACANTFGHGTQVNKILPVQFLK